jgi:membrane-bound serine protease (ClpP class)
MKRDAGDGECDNPAVDIAPAELVTRGLFDPTVAYVLFVIGSCALIVELAHPGAVVPGVTGVVCLGLALFGFASLPINWIGLALIVAGLTLVGLAWKTTTHGGLALGGIVCLVIGSLRLYGRTTDGANLADVTVALPVVIAVAVAGVALALVLMRIAASVRRLPPALSLGQLMGARGTVRTALNPEGVVQVRGQLWSARVRSGQLEAGESIRVTGREGLVLDVESTTFRGAATQKGRSR